MSSLDFIAERSILQAIARGDFDDLPGAGKPLEIDDDPLVPPETRIACRILKNAGFVPLELLERAEIARLEAALPGLEESERARALTRVALLRARMLESRIRARASVIIPR
ncbi:MAG TPA: DnaJ family domain-containing protein [Burkholderiales bacterium]|nr:DnaJ family domain-containing protein [Burkholderiales bacterium]